MSTLKAILAPEWLRNTTGWMGDHLVESVLIFAFIGIVAGLVWGYYNETD